MACFCRHVLTCEDVGVPCERFPGTEFWPVLSDEEWAAVMAQESEAAQ